MSGTLQRIEKILPGGLRRAYQKARSKYVERFVMPSDPEKREIIKGYKDKTNLNVFVETGTFLGDTVETLKGDFDRLYSIELSEELTARAQKRFASDAKVTIIQGDSGNELHALLDQLKEPALFWLDGHYSSEFFVGDEYIETAKGAKFTPILEELSAIFSHSIKSHVILIDDARCFVGSHDYPSLKEVKTFIRNHNPKLQVTVKRDIIRVVPG
jgi:hypothetical protein